MSIQSFSLLSRLSFALAALTLLPFAAAAPAHAQGKTSGAPTLTPTQQKKAQTLATQYQKTLQTLGTNKALSQSQKQAKFQSLTKAYQSDMMAILTPAQRAQVKQGQQAGMQKQQAFMKAHQSQIDEARTLGKELNASITADQKAKVNTLNQAARTQALAIQNDKSLTAQAKTQKLQALQKDSQTKALAVLTPAQRAKIQRAQQLQMQLQKDMQAAQGH